MATIDAVSCVCNAVVHILSAAMQTDGEKLGLSALNPKFEVYSGRDFTNSQSTNHITSGASVFLYRALPNLNHRTPAGRLLSDGRRQHSQLPLDLHLIVTVWGKDANTQNRLVGWVLRTLEDYPSIPPSILNINQAKPVFKDDESVQLTLSEIEGEELLQLWDMLGNDGGLYYQISIPYVARNVYVESKRTDEPIPDVQIRTLDMQRVVVG